MYHCDICLDHVEDYEMCACELAVGGEPHVGFGRPTVL